MGQMQTKILGRLRELAEASGLEFVDQPRYANTGTAYAQAADFRTAALLSYSFQDTYATVEITADSIQCRSRMSGSPNTLWLRPGYHDQADMQRLFAAFTAAIKGLVINEREQVEGAGRARNTAET